MSIEKMINLHPDVQGAGNESLATSARHAMLCNLMCTSCADACLAEEMDMRQCIRSCLDCADVCAATARLAVRRTGSNVSSLELMLQTCVTICDRCGEECRHHMHAHCQLCAQMCFECARDCRSAISELA
ncbi:four-helix bundle copper-binding protein [Novosphingobium terrae]|uniref:four-helix bundle copper-binding protein n=1 Tax=Novosphingobium terrae TaxID=2726189 RepID=UPI00197E3E82|nr:four-helix bundle copper-binding protein [Novosphingobium terrae]